MKNLFGLTVAFLASISAYAIEYKCPGNIESNQTVKSKAEGWTAWPDRLNTYQNLASVNVYSGHPNDGAILVPDNEDDTKKASFWTLSGDTWMSCVYQQTYIRYVKQLPTSTKKCTLLYTTGKFKQMTGLSCE